MALFLEERQIPARTEKVCVKRTCDCCGREADHPDRGNWEARTSYDVSTVEISMEEGSSFPEGAVKERTVFDMCPECFKTKLMPFLESLGMKPRTKDTGW